MYNTKLINRRNNTKATNQFYLKIIKCYNNFH